MDVGVLLAADPPRTLDGLKLEDEDEQIGVQIVRRALESPLREIANNAGVEGAVVVEQIRQSKTPNYGYNAATGEYVDMFKAGIIDPTKVARTALLNAASVAGLALTVRYLAGGREELRAAAPILPGVLLGIGMFLSAGVGLAALLFGGDVLQSWILQAEIPILGDVKLVTSLFFDIGVYLVVVGLVLDVLRSLGGGLDAQIERARQHEGSDQ